MSSSESVETDKDRGIIPHSVLVESPTIVKHEGELKKAEDQERREREIRKEEMLKARQLRMNLTGPGTGSEKPLDPAKVDIVPPAVELEAKDDTPVGFALLGADDSGDEQEQREVERLLQAEHDRLAGIQSLGGLSPETRHERLVTIASGMPSVNLAEKLNFQTKDDH